MSPVWRWRLAFLGMTAITLAMELVAAFDGSEVTRPWTAEIVDYIPAWVTFSAIGVLVLWLPAHFWLRYRRKHQSRQGDSSE